MERKLSNEQCYDTLYKIRSNFPSSREAAYTGALKTTDPVLRNIALYFAENYMDFKVRCTSCNDDCENYCSKLCKYLNGWVNEKKSLYTCNGNCKYNTKLFKQYIEELWNQFKMSEEKQDWCIRSDNTSAYNFPHDKIPDSCNNDNPTEFSVICASTTDDDHYVLAPSSTCSSVSSVSLSVGYVLFGILLISILLYKISPLGIRLKKLVHRKITRDDRDEEERDEIFRNTKTNTMQSLSNGFNVVYNSMIETLY
ncbi:PIR protein [Plasmodium ovale]|uniref:PIR protein n=1 Tax=Plasmodium ovale TaxID=36330 RepID=A0A1D3JDE4_PLAOA|nr:PIR protein [Plasmodium ovale]